MNKQDFIYHLENPAEISETDVATLITLLEDFPFCTNAQILLAKGLNNTNNSGYDTQLKKAASYAPDRKVLYKHLMQEKLIDVIEQVESGIVKSEPQLGSEENEQQDSGNTDLGTLEHEIISAAVSASISLEVSEPASDDKQLNQPDGIDFGSKHSFAQWLNPAGKEEKGRRETFDDIIDRFIQSDPNAKSEKIEMFSPENIAKLSLVDNEEFVTETLAGVYAKQGNIEKARKAYEQLSLKFPEKSAYFARLLKGLDKKE